MAMYREIVERRRVPVIFLLFIVLSFIIVLSDILSKITFGSYKVGEFSKIIFSIIMFAIVYRQVTKCNIRYKYSVMGDQLIIHRINGKEESLVEDIDFKNIKFIGIEKKCENKLCANSSKKYLCSLVHFHKYCCIYESDNKIKKFYFEPSDTLIKKIKCDNIVM